jgi:hypothetical protein
MTVSKGQRAERKIREFNMMEAVIRAVSGVFRGRSSGRGE